MILKNNKGAALMQVLLVTVVLAGMSAMYCDSYNTSGECSSGDAGKHRFYDCSASMDGQNLMVRAWLYDTRGEAGEVDGYPVGEMTGRTAGPDNNMLQMVFEVVDSDSAAL